MFRPNGMARAAPATGLWHGSKFLDDRACAALLDEICLITTASPLRRMTTPHGKHMQVSMSNCGSVGWVSDKDGYRYSEIDPATGKPWPDMPARWLDLAGQIALIAGFPGFVPDVALINRYEPGTSLGLHQDKDEVDFAQPIVSVSLGCRATFLMGGVRRGDPTRRIQLGHGDALVFGGRSRMCHHGVARVVDDGHEARCRWNITFRKAR